jgi:transcriptional regulator with XRE-family HTH domain
MQKVNDIIKQKRESRGISIQEICSRTGLSANQYEDLESYPHEFFEQISLGKVKKVCHVLEIDVKSLLVESSEQKSFPQRSVPRNLLVTQERERLGLTREQLADQIGYETIAIEQVEAEEDYIDSMSPSAILDIARVLKMNPCLLV